MLRRGRARAGDPDAIPLNEATDEFERQLVLQVLERTHWNLSETSRLLRLHRNSLKRKLAHWKLARPDGD
jgi:DNA-binding NtrC family response regulator